MTDIDEIRLSFGKYKGLTPHEVAEIDPSYVVWMHTTVNPAPCSKELRLACEQDVREYEEEKKQDLYYGFDGWNE